MIIFLKKYMSKKALIVFVCVLICTSGLEKAYTVMAEETENEPKLHAVSAALYDADDETFVYGKNMRDSMANASTTKLLTCIVALEKADINDMVTVSQNAASQPAVKLGLVPGESYRLKDLLYGMMLESFNDCAYAIAEHVGGSTEGFAKLMNEKANEIGCLGTYFITPNGLDAENDVSFHHSTAGDLCVIMSYCAWESPKSAQFLEITQTMQYTFESGDGQVVFNNHNRLLTETDYCISGKTGFTTKAGYCYVAAVEKDGRKMCLSLLGCGWPNNKNYKWADAKALVEYALSKEAVDSYSDAALVTMQQTADKSVAGENALAAKKEDRNKINLKYLENNKKNKKICKNFLKNFTINIGNFF
nr:serine hydrolase [uncultured Agathobacter sp.]